MTTTTENNKRKNEEVKDALAKDATLEEGNNVVENKPSLKLATDNGKTKKVVVHKEETDTFGDSNPESMLVEGKLLGKGYMKQRTQEVDSDIGQDGGATWEELKAIEKRRRAILLRTELPLHRALMFWDGTCLRLLVKDWLFWITVFVYALARLFIPRGYSDVVYSGDIAIISAFLSFFLVFFVVQSNERYIKLYGESMKIVGCINNLATLSRVELSRERGQRLLRYMNAAHVAAYVGLSDNYTKKNFFNPINKSWKLLTDKEHERMIEIDMDDGGSCCRELIVWSMIEVQDALRIDLLDRYIARRMRGLILEFRGSVSTLYDYADQPVSFFYVHFIMLLSSLYLPLFAVSIASGAVESELWLADAVSGLIVFLQALFVVGLRILGQKLADPYGGDLEDLSVMHYVNDACRTSQRILASKNPPPFDDMEEDNLSRKQTEALGEAWKTSPAAAAPVIAGANSAQA
jgi:predicted membrane chloride channel (bestrophin family)